MRNAAAPQVSPTIRSSCADHTLQRFALLLGQLQFLELILAIVLATGPHDSGKAWVASLSTFVAVSILGTLAGAGYIISKRLSKNLYFTSDFQSRSILFCFLCWLAGSTVWLLLAGYFWTDWVLAAKVYQYHGRLLVEENPQIRGIYRGYAFAYLLPVLSL